MAERKPLSVQFVARANPLPWVYDDGGRKAAGYKGDTGDCVVRAIAIASCLSYQDVYDGLREALVATKAKARRGSKAQRYPTTPRAGIPSPVIRKYLTGLGWAWQPTMGIGTGCRVHLAVGELPPGRLIARLANHTCAVVDGVVRDTHNPNERTFRDGTEQQVTRCCYGFWYDPTELVWKRGTS